LRSSCFLSSRRRHTTFSRDWSSDVCSSDLGQASWPARRSPVTQESFSHSAWSAPALHDGSPIDWGWWAGLGRRDACPPPPPCPQIGRAACRERVTGGWDAAYRTAADV